MSKPPIDWSKWLPTIISILIIGGGGLATGAVIVNKQASFESRLTNVEQVRATDHDLLINLSSDMGWVKNALKEIISKGELR